MDSPPPTPSSPGPPSADQPRDLGEIVRQKIGRGELPKVEEASLTMNLGSITACAACGAPITGLEYIAELHDGRQFRFHGVCVEVWQLERGTGGERPQLVQPIPDWEGNNPEIPCTACGLRIQPFIHRYVLRGESFHPVCYDRMQQGDAAPP